jgi:hypothetical protein
MIRKAQRSDMSPMDPTPEQIRQRTEEIRRTWSPRERARRSRFKQATWMPPLFSENDLPGFVASDFESR